MWCSAKNLGFAYLTYIRAAFANSDGACTSWAHFDNLLPGYSISAHVLYHKTRRKSKKKISVYFENFRQNVSENLKQSSN
jgi:hypothetical protein